MLSLLPGGLAKPGRPSSGRPDFFWIQSSRLGALNICGEGIRIEDIQITAATEAIEKLMEVKNIGERPGEASFLSYPRALEFPHQEIGIEEEIMKPISIAALQTFFLTTIFRSFPT
jgi:hypothetical protein